MLKRTASDWSLGFVHFYCEKLYLWPETWTGGLIDPLGLKGETHGGENLAGGSSPQCPVNSHPGYKVLFFRCSYSNPGASLRQR